MLRIVFLVAFLALATQADAGAPRIVATADVDPVWSPGGKKLAFTRVRSGGDELWVLDAHTTRLRRLAANPYKLLPSWSGDARRLVFQARGSLWIATMESGAARRIDLNLTGQAFAPVWSPTADLILFLSTYDSRNTDLWVTSPDGKNVDRMARDVVGRPVWSPDGEPIAYQRDHGIYIAGVGVVARVANPGPPAWSPNGRLLAFAAAGRLWVVRADGSAPAVPVTPRAPAMGAPTWITDDRIAFVRTGGLRSPTSRCTRGGSTCPSRPRPPAASRSRRARSRSPPRVRIAPATSGSVRTSPRRGP